MDFQQTALTVCGATAAYMVAYALYKRYRTTSISDIQGPDSPSWIYGSSLSPISLATSPHRFWIRTPAVVAMRRGQCRREGPSGTIRCRRSLERDVWGGPLPDVECHDSLTLTLSRRNNACGSQIPRPSTTFSRVLICTSSHPTPWS